jgi:hypothetical protein
MPLVLPVSRLNVQLTSCGVDKSTRMAVIHEKAVESTPFDRSKLIRDMETDRPGMPVVQCLAAHQLWSSGITNKRVVVALGATTLEIAEAPAANAQVARSGLAGCSDDMRSRGLPSRNAAQHSDQIAKI